MKIFSQNYDFNYSWDEVSTSNWRKYCPWNEKTPHVIAVDTLSRHVDAATGILRTERLITCQQSAPKWLATFLGGQDTSTVYEISYVDPSSQKVTMCSLNLTWNDLLTVRETVTYTADPSAPHGRTKFNQRAEITALCGGWQNIKNKIEQFTVDRFKQNAERGRQGFEMVLERAREVFQEERQFMMLQQAFPEQRGRRYDYNDDDVD